MGILPAPLILSKLGVLRLAVVVYCGASSQGGGCYILLGGALFEAIIRV